MVNQQRGPNRPKPNKEKSDNEAHWAKHALQYNTFLRLSPLVFSFFLLFSSSSPSAYFFSFEFLPSLLSFRGLEDGWSSLKKAPKDKLSIESSFFSIFSLASANRRIAGDDVRKNESR